jgi:type I restriction enzyme S subunit
MNWEEIRLEEIAEFRNGVNFTNDSFGKGIKVINVADFKDKMYPDYEALGELDAEAKWPKECFLKENDIVFVRSNGNKNLIGRSIFIKNLPEDIKVTYSAFSIRLRFKCIKDICPEFYLYLFKSPIFRSILSQYGNGANISNLNQDILNNMVISRPPLPIQLKIASILSSYDDLIENNKQRINLLEQMATEIYKEWFVCMRFPGYETAMFVDGLPEGWENGILGDLVEFKKGRNITEDTVIEGKVPVVAGGLTPAYFHNTANTASPTITISASGANAGYVNFYYEDIWASDCSFLDTKSTNCIFFYYMVMKNRQTEITFLQKGSAQPHVYPKDIMSLKMIKPSSTLIESFENIITPFFEEIKTLSLKNQLLQQTRDLLLPRLISGKLSVEHLVEEVVHLPMAAEPEVTFNTKRLS